jgi:uncharacterized protein (DUF2267 family)
MKAATTKSVVEQWPKIAFVRCVASHACLPPHVTPEAASIAVMCAVIERLTRGRARMLLSALPEPVRAMFEGCMAHRTGPASALDRPELLEQTAANLGITRAHAEDVCRAVLVAVREQVPSSLADDVARELPAGLKELWFSMPSAGAPVADASTTDPEVVRRAVFAAMDEAAFELPHEIDGGAVFAAVMCIFSQRLSGGEARHVWLALPNTLRALVTACMLHRDEAAVPFSRDEFLHRVSEHLGTPAALSEKLVRIVFAAVKRCLPDREIQNAASQLPPDLRILWLES